ncbi:hypothetical protein BT69DRAFT_1278649 [Atractiella rhizophila]|nr:hypothetical protein BT69DRAFT_1278649 [Atractiella rhizophila]
MESLLSLNDPPTHVSQRRLTRINQQILIVSTILAFIIGFAFQSVPLVFQIFFGGVLVDAIIIVPSWGVWRSGEEGWLKSKGGKEE